jgi:anti-sigma regulatory factor (Ser/Thr protein kinase)
MSVKTLTERIQNIVSLEYDLYISGKFINKETDLKHEILSDIIFLDAKQTRTLIKNLTTSIPEFYSPNIYRYFILKQLYKYLTASENFFSKIETQVVNSFVNWSKWFLIYGDYTNCISCCRACIANRKDIADKNMVTVLFNNSKALRNEGQYARSLKTLCEALSIINNNADLKYLKGSALLRIGKVYLNYLMQSATARYFFIEAEKELALWLEYDNEMIKNEATVQYAICLDALGQMEKESNPQLSTKYFHKAYEYNFQMNRTSGIFRNYAHILVSEFRECKPGEKDKIDALILSMKSIIRNLLDDDENIRGAGVRYIQLAEMQKAVNDYRGGLDSINRGSEIARMFSDYKTLIRAVKEKYEVVSYLGDMNDEFVREIKSVLNLAKEKNLLVYQHELNYLIIKAINHYQFTGENIIYYLQENRTVYEKLRTISENSITKVLRRNYEKNEFTHLVEMTKKEEYELIGKVINDYNLIIKRLNDIIDELLNKYESLTSELFDLGIAQAKASLASGLLHDFKHIMKTASDDTVLDEALKILENEEIDIENDLNIAVSKISLVNDKFKSIYPQIIEAQKIPVNFKEKVNLRSSCLFAANVIEKEYSFVKKIKVSCDDELLIIYNNRSMQTLIKELLRNAVIYSSKNNVSVKKFVIEIKEIINKVVIKIGTVFEMKSDAANAQKQLAKQMSYTDSTIDNGFGLSALRNFMQSMTGGAERPSFFSDKNTVGIIFSFPNNFIKR